MLPYFRASTLDDLLRDAVGAAITAGDPIHPSKGPACELRGAMLELTNPRARLSRTETRGHPFSCLGELCWYLSGDRDLKQIAYYLPAYHDFAEGDLVYGGYGPRLLKWNGLNQLDRAIRMLRRKPDSRQVVIQIFDRTDLSDEHRDVPCTCTLHFMHRKGNLDLIVYMRSNDLYWGFPHDVFSFTMLQEVVARSIDADLGTYKHAVGSLHLYNHNEDDMRRFLDEGWQSTTTEMPPMPIGDPWPFIASLLEHEVAARSALSHSAVPVPDGDSYWDDLKRLLSIFRLSKYKDLHSLEAVSTAMCTNVYDVFIRARVDQLSKDMDVADSASED